MDAKRLEGGARRVEKRFEKRLANFLSLYSLDALPSADFFSQLSEATAVELAANKAAFDLVLVSGTVVQMKHSTSRVKGIGPDGGSVSVDLPTKLLTAGGYSEGVPLWVLTRLVGSSAVVELERTVTVQVADKTAADLPWAQVDQSEYALPAGTEYAETDEFLLQEYNATGGANPDEAYMAKLLKDVEAGALPRQVLQPLG